MENREIKLAVNNLGISFKTANGKVQAVRNIDFNLYKGETLAIVGESGSGKSVTTKAILGILANNAIRENGEIIYDGMDLMKISEEDFCKIRGDRISMIFQDPLSSLNPIMRIGKQMTEAMIINGKINRRNCRKDFNSTLALLEKSMNFARGENDPAITAENKTLCYNFNKFEIKHLELENAYNAAHEACVEARDMADDILFHIEKNATDKLLHDIKEFVKLAEKSVSRYVVHDKAEELNAKLEELKVLTKVPFMTQVRNFVVPIFNRNATIIDNVDYAKVAENIKAVKAILAEAAEFVMPNFFAMGYYLTFADQPLPDMPVDELNVFMRKYLDDNFMLEFIKLAKMGIVYSCKQSAERKKQALEILEKEANAFTHELDRKEASAAVKALVAAVENGIDRLETVKDNVAYTFKSSIKAAVKSYFDGIKRNAKEEKRFAKQSASYNKKVEKGKTPDWKIADKNLVDLAEVREDIIALIKRVKARFETNIAGVDAVDFDERAVGMIDYLKAKASGVAHKVTHAMAKARSLKLMEEVGIPEPRRRYRQYPFEFSGGMRQRIVIAIALSADPDILICDEPTTALDVTIQSQILELINKVKVERQLSVIFITHDLGVVANMADRVAVMYAGKIVEIGTSEDIFYSPAHPYTWALLSSMPDLDTKEKLEAIPGTPPNMIYPPKGDAFAERNKFAMKIDFEEQPPMFKISDTHYAATWLLHPSAPKVDPPKVVVDRIARMKAKANGKPANQGANEVNEAEVSEVVESHADEVKAAGVDAAPDSEMIENVKAGLEDDARNGSTVTTEEMLATTDGVAAKPKKPAAKKTSSAKSTTAKKTSSTKSTTAKKTSSTKSTAAKKPAAAKKTAAKGSADKSADKDGGNK